MLALFRTNQSLLNILLVFYAAGLHIVAFVFLDHKTQVTPGILSEGIFNWIGTTGPVPIITTILLLAIQGTMLNILVTSNRLTKEVNLFPGVFYILIASSLIDFSNISPLHLANTFLIIVLLELMSTYKKPAAADRIFNTGFWTAVASLFYFSYIVFLLLIFVALNVLRAFNIKERLMFLTGALVPYILTGLYYFWNDQWDYFIQHQFIQNISYFDFEITGNDIIDYVKLGLFALLVIIGILSFGKYTYKQNIQVQKKISIIFWTMLIAFLSIFFQANIHLENLLIIAVPLGLLLSFNLTLMQKQYAEVLHFLLLVLVILLQFQTLILN